MERKPPKTKPEVWPLAFALFSNLITAIINKVKATTNGQQRRNSPRRLVIKQSIEIWEKGVVVKLSLFTLCVRVL